MTFFSIHFLGRAKCCCWQLLSRPLRPGCAWRLRLPELPDPKATKEDSDMKQQLLNRIRNVKTKIQKREVLSTKETQLKSFLEQVRVHVKNEKDRHGQETAEIQQELVELRAQLDRLRSGSAKLMDLWQLSIGFDALRSLPFRSSNLVQAHTCNQIFCPAFCPFKLVGTKRATKRGDQRRNKVGQEPANSGVFKPGHTNRKPQDLQVLGLNTNSMRSVSPTPLTYDQSSQCRSSSQRLD